MRYAHIADGIIVNVSVWTQTPPETDEHGHALVEADQADIGWSWDGTSFSPPPFEPDPNDSPGVL